MGPDARAYSLVDGCEPHHLDASEGEEKGEQLNVYRIMYNSKAYPVVLSFVSGFLTAALLILLPTQWLPWRGARPSTTPYSNHKINELSKRLSAYSPVLNLVDMGLSTQTFNGALWDNTSIWRMPPSPEVDAAWDRISAQDMQLIAVSSSDIDKSGKDPAVCVKAPETWGLGDDAYIAQVEVFHQIHCLDELRKEIHYDHYYQSPPTALHRSHKSHCIHVLLQALMCSADVGIVTHNWIHDDDYSEPKTRPFPDFSVEKKCRNFTRIMDWLRETGGIKDLQEKFPMAYPAGAPITSGKGYTVSIDN